MAYGLVLVFEGVSEADYWAVNENLGVSRDGSGDWPADLTHHSAGATATGLVVCEVWTSKAAQEQFMASRLGAALGAAGVTPPAQVIEYEVANTHAG